MFIAMTPSLRFPGGPQRCTRQSRFSQQQGQSISASGICSEICLALRMHLVDMAVQAGVWPKIYGRETYPVNKSLC